MKNLRLKLTVALLSFFIFVPSIAPVAANDDLQQELDELRGQIDDINRQQKELEQAIEQERNSQNEINSELRLLQREQALIQSEIDEKELKISELNLQIELLNQRIVDTEKTIEENESEVEELDEKAQIEISRMYLDQKSNNGKIDLFFASGEVDFVKTGLYQQTINNDTNNALKQLKDLQEKLEQDRVQLEQDKTQVDSDKASIEEERVALDEKRAELQPKINRFAQLFSEAQRSISSSEDAYASLDDQEERLQARLTLLKQQISDSVGSITNGTFVAEGTIIGIEGNTGVSTGAHLHFGVRINGAYVNPCSHLPSKQLANTTCGVGNPSIPGWPMDGSPWFTSGFRTASRPTHNAIDLSTGGGAAIYASHD
ncbi:MAG: murein hydrolase activator EnvC family protein, partial [Candidatus Dojkabacteria bacterium]